MPAKPEKPREILIYGRRMAVDENGKVNWGQLFDGHYQGVSDMPFSKVGDGSGYLVEASSVWIR